jgi:hypothetical protein
MVKGNLSSREAEFITINVRSCREVADDPDTECESEKEISKNGGNVFVRLLYKNFYFDQEEFKSDPVKPYFKTSLSGMLEEFTSQKFMKVTKNLLKLSDKWFSSSI